MKQLKLMGFVGIVALLVALTYYIFESAVHHAEQYFWYDLFDIDAHRWLLIPLTFGLTLVFFWLQRTLDPGSSEHEQHGIGADAEGKTWRDVGIVLLIGFFSLLAGASLGPEAVLVPACIAIGAVVAGRHYRMDQQSLKALTVAAIVALFTAFFHSFIVGILTVFLVAKASKTKPTSQLWTLSAVAAFVAYLTLVIIDPSETFFHTPELAFSIQPKDTIALIILFGASYAAVFMLAWVQRRFAPIRSYQQKQVWWQQALIAAAGLIVIYLIAGPLVQFTGNDSINPLLDQAKTLGLLGILGLGIAKIVAIAWSRTMGYRGGLVFPMIFVLSTFIAAALLYLPELSFLVAMIACIAGMLVAERKAKILF